MSNLVYLKITGEIQGNISSGCGTPESIGNRWQLGHENEILVFSLDNTITNTGKGINIQGIRFQKLIDKSSPLLTNAITKNERLFIEINFYRINRTGRWERYYYIQLRNASLVGLYMDAGRNDIDTQDVIVIYDYILCKHLIANTEYDYMALPTDYNSMFIPRQTAPISDIIPEPTVPPAPTPQSVTPVYAKSCLKEKGCTDAGTTDEPAENFGQLAIFAQPVIDDCCGYRGPHDVVEVKQPVQPVESTMAPLALMGSLAWGEWSLSGVFTAARGIPYIGALASALYIPSAGEGSDRVPGRDEYWYEEELRQKALAGRTATTRVRFFWRDDIHGQPQVYGVHTGEGTPYEGVRVANMLWNKHTQRYEFTPAEDVDEPLITWTPTAPDDGNVPTHTGNNTPPIDQTTILVTPIPTDQNSYTTPPFPIPDVEDFNDYILVFPADSGIQPIYVYLKTARDEPGVAVGKGNLLSGNEKWLEAANSGLGAPVPTQVADKLRGKSFRNFDHFRKEFWLAVAECPELMKDFKPSNQVLIRMGLAPYPIPSEQVGGRTTFELHHLE